MKIFKLFSIFLFLIVFSCVSSTKNDNFEAAKTPKFAIAIHGGAGTILKSQMSDSLEKAYSEVLARAVQSGHNVLSKGGSALDAVEASINILEDSPLFNAGKGAVFTHDRTNELDASIMDGSSLNAGAVAGVKHIKNPINLARSVMEASPHVFMYGEGAEAFAQDQGFTMVDQDYFFTQSRFDHLMRVQKAQEPTSAAVFYDPILKDSKFGTVGCVALDKEGNLAAGTSTGGMTNKRFGRIGDAPVIGAGTYANNKSCAVSATGWGEYFIRGVVAHDIAAMMEYGGLDLATATSVVIDKKIPELGGDGGVIAMDNQGEISMRFNTEGMYRAQIGVDGQLKVGIYKSDALLTK
jgi:beta-aspartyl-peptidase (threonine type)